MVNVITYCRVSSEEQAQKDLSIPAHRKALRRWVDEKPDHALLHEFEDQGESAYAPADKRPGFCEMISFCRRNDVHHILVHKLDRFSRNREESILFKSLLRKHGVTVVSITEAYDPETPQGFLYEGMIEVINQFYSMNLATETLKGMKENAERGFHNGGRIPYGYRLTKVAVGGREHRKLVPGPDEEVAVIREIFELAVNHRLGSKRIANALNSKGTQAPRSRHWNGSTIDAILNNRVYVGDQVWLKSRKVGRDGRRRTAEDERIVTEDAHEALITREQFEERRALAESRRFKSKRATSQPVSYLLSRLIRCDHCGNNFVGQRQTATNAAGQRVVYRRYYCSGYLTKGKSVCQSLPIKSEWIEAFVLDLLRHKLHEAGVVEELERLVRDRVEARRSTYGQDPKAVERKLDEIDRRIAHYYRAIGDGLDPSICQQHIAELTAKKAQLEEEAGVLRREDYYDRALEMNIAELRRFARAFNDEFETLPFAAKRRAVLYFVEKVVIVERKAVQVHFKVPFDNNGIKLLTDEVVGSGAAVSESGDHVGGKGLLSNVYMQPTTGSFIRPRLVSLGLSLNRTLVGEVGGGLVVLTLVARVCGRSLVDAGALWSGGARVPRLVAGPRPVLSESSWASETPPDAEKPVHTREPMVHGSRVGQPLGSFVVGGSPDETVVRDSISRELPRTVPCRNTPVLSGISGSGAETPPRAECAWKNTLGRGTYDSGKLRTHAVSDEPGSQS